MLRLLLAMALTFIGTGGTADGVTSAIAPIPSGLVGDQLVICVTGLHSGTPSTPTASGFTSPFENHIWFDAADHSSDTLVAAVLRREADGTEDSTVTVSTFGWTKCKVECLRFRGTTSWKDLEAGAAYGLVTSQVYTATLTGSGDFDPPDLRTGDYYVAITCLESTGYSTGSHDIDTNAGMTWGSSAVRDADSPNIPGTRFHTIVSIHLGATGSDNFGEPSVLFSTSIPLSANGVTVLFRLREEAVDAEPSVGDTITVGVTETLGITVALAVQDTATVGLTDGVSVEQQTAEKSVSDTITVALTDAVSADVLEDLKSVSDTITVALTDAVSVEQDTAEKSVSDTITVALTDQVTTEIQEQAKSVSDTISVRVTDTPLITVDVRIVTGITVGLTDEVTVVDTLTPKSVADTITIALTDLVSIFELTDFLTVSDGIAVALDEQVLVSVELFVADTITVALTDAVSVFELTDEISVGDTISVGLTDQVTVDVTQNPVSVSDDIDVGLTDDVTITVTLNRLDILFIGLEEALSIEATLSVSDTISVGLTDEVSVEVTFIPGQPMIRRFSQTHAIWPINVGRERGWIA